MSARPPNLRGDDADGDHGGEMIPAEQRMGDAFDKAVDMRAAGMGERDRGR